mgnify:CR=1 FL=1
MIDGEKSIRWEELSEEEARRHNLCKALLKGRRCRHKCQAYDRKRMLKGMGKRTDNDISPLFLDPHIFSSFSTPIFFTVGFQIFLGIQAGAVFGLVICFLLPLNTWTFLVPRSLSFISINPLVAAFKAACRGDVPVKTLISLPSASLRAKFLFSAMNIPPTQI